MALRRAASALGQAWIHASSQGSASGAHSRHLLTPASSSALPCGARARLANAGGGSIRSGYAPHFRDSASTGQNKIRSLSDLHQGLAGPLAPLARMLAPRGDQGRRSALIGLACAFLHCVPKARQGLVAVTTSHPLRFQALSLPRRRALSAVSRSASSSSKAVSSSSLPPPHASRLSTPLFSSSPLHTLRSFSRRFSSQGATPSHFRPLSFLRTQCRALTQPKPRNLSSITASAPQAAAMATGHAASAAPLVAGGAGVQRAVAGWLFGCAAWTFCMVVLGGVTRLTRSGLSITDWKFSGQLPPLTQLQWETEFEKYKQYPEYKRVNRSISLQDFKFIYWMEYAHRMWGRALGLLFALPFAYFAARGCIPPPLGRRLLLLLSLGAAQGFVGWWMVKSGLEEPKDEHAVPRVSPYRLAAHLTSAFLIFSLLLWTGLSVAMPLPPMDTAVQLAAAARLRPWAHNTAALIGITAFSGAFVAGNDAGRAFNTFPMMGDHWVPPQILQMSPLHRNFFENTATVQFQHRLLALSTLASVAALYLWAKRLPLHPASALLLNTAMGVTVLQVTLGITTLLSYVPVSLGAAHQAGALTLFTVFLGLLHTLRRPKGASVTKLITSQPL